MGNQKNHENNLLPSYKVQLAIKIKKILIKKIITIKQ